MKNPLIISVIGEEIPKIRAVVKKAFKKGLKRILEPSGLKNRKDVTRIEKVSIAFSEIMVEKTNIRVKRKDRRESLVKPQLEDRKIKLIPPVVDGV